MSNVFHTHGQPPRGDRFRRLRNSVTLLLGAAGLTAGLAIAQGPSASAPVPAASGVIVNAPIDLPAPPATNPRPAVHPNWSELTIVQQRILAPLAPEWNDMPELARKKWLQIAQAYPKYTPAQQQRLQTRMADWVKLTPEQRHRARENFQTTKSVPLQKKSEAWQSYQKLTDEQKKALGRRRQGAEASVCGDGAARQCEPREGRCQGGPSRAHEAWHDALDAAWQGDGCCIQPRGRAGSERCLGACRCGARTGQHAPRPRATRGAVHHNGRRIGKSAAVHGARRLSRHTLWHNSNSATQALPAHVGLRLPRSPVRWPLPLPPLPRLRRTMRSQRPPCAAVLRACSMKACCCSA